MERFVKVMALFGIFLLALYAFDKFQPTLTTLPKVTPLTTYALYEVRQLQWDFDDPLDYDYNDALIGISNGEAKLKLQVMQSSITENTELKLPRLQNSELEIDNIEPGNYGEEILEVGDKYYVDMDYKLLTLPEQLQGMTWIKTANNHKNRNGNVTFATNAPATVFVGYDKRKDTVPDWLSSWTYWGEGITTEDSASAANPFKIYYRSFPAGTISLGSNNKASSMYVVLINSTGYEEDYEHKSQAHAYNGTLKTIAFAADAPEGTAVKFQLRTAQTQQGLESAQWLGPTSESDYYTSPGGTVNQAHGSSGGWLQYKAVLETMNPANTPTLSSVTIASEKSSYAESAAVATKDYEFQKSVEVQQITDDEELNGQSISHSYSTDSGSTWTTASLNSPLSVKTGKIMLKATLNSNTTRTPTLKAITVNYRISVCDENWQASYTSCGKDNARTKYYTDANICGSTEDLPADNGAVESCDYCTPQWINENSSCRSDDTFAVNYFYTSSCCGETGLASDCTIPANTTAACDYCTPLWTETNGSCGKDDKIVATFNDVNNCYAQTWLASDSGRQQNKTYRCAYDNEGPIIGNVTAKVAQNTLTVTANIVDKSEVTAAAQIVKDGKALMNLTLINASTNTYSASQDVSALRGAYVISIIAEDEYNNTAFAKGKAGIALFAEESAITNVALNSTEKATLRPTNATVIQLEGKPALTGTVTGNIVVAEHKSDIRNTTKPSGKKELRKYLEIEAAEEIKSNVSSATIRISYSDEEASAANVSEISLALYFYNETSSLWQLLNSTANTELNYVEGNTTHLSLFGIFGTEQNQTGADSTQQQPQTATETPAAAKTEGVSAGRAKNETKPAEKEGEAVAVETEVTKACAYDVNVELAGKPSFINMTRINATLTNTGTCELQNIEVRVTPPLDGYVAIENSKASRLGPAESLEFAVKLNTTAAQAAPQPLQGFAVKEPRKVARKAGKIMITGKGIKGLGLELESSEVQFSKEVPLNIELYELEQQGGKNAASAIIIGALVLLGVAGIGYGMMKRGKKRGETEKQKLEIKHEEAAGFEKGLQMFEEKWKEQQQKPQQSQHEKSLEGFRETFK